MSIRKGKRLEVYLPEDHQIFKIPAGQRSQKVREALDLADRLGNILASLDARLARIEQILSSGLPVQLESKTELEKKPGVEIDIEAFMDL